MAADKADAALLVQLAQWGTMMGLDAAVTAVFDDGFDSETASTEDNVHVRTVLQFGETLGTLTKHGVLDTELVTDWLWVAGLWGTSPGCCPGSWDGTGCPAMRCSSSCEAACGCGSGECGLSSPGAIS